MGFQDMREVVLKAASRKGGKVRVKKGLAKLSKERRKEIASMGGKAHANRDKIRIKEETRQSDSTPRVGDVLGDIDE